MKSIKIPYLNIFVILHSAHMHSSMSHSWSLRKKKQTSFIVLHLELINIFKRGDLHMVLYTPNAVPSDSSFSSFKSSHLGLKETAQYIRELTKQAWRPEFKPLAPYKNKSGMVACTYNSNTGKQTLWACWSDSLAEMANFQFTELPF